MHHIYSVRKDYEWSYYLWKWLILWNKCEILCAFIFNTFLFAVPSFNLLHILHIKSICDVIKCILYISSINAILSIIFYLWTFPDLEYHKVFYLSRSSQKLTVRNQYHLVRQARALCYKTFCDLNINGSIPSLFWKNSRNDSVAILT